MSNESFGACGGTGTGQRGAGRGLPRACCNPTRSQRVVPQSTDSRRCSMVLVRGVRGNSVAKRYSPAQSSRSPAHATRCTTALEGQRASLSARWGGQSAATFTPAAGLRRMPRCHAAAQQKPPVVLPGALAGCWQVGPR